MIAAGTTATRKAMATDPRRWLSMIQVIRCCDEGLRHQFTPHLPVVSSRRAEVMMGYTQRGQSRGERVILRAQGVLGAVVEPDIGVIGPDLRSYRAYPFRGTVVGEHARAAAKDGRDPVRPHVAGPALQQAESAGMVQPDVEGPVTAR